MKKRYLYLLAMLSIFTLGKAQNKFGFGFRVNQAVMQKITTDADGHTFFATDYTAFIQYKSAGFFGGITALNNYNNVTIPGNQNLNCFNAGLFFRVKQFKHNDALCLYLYTVHFYNSLNAIVVPAHTVNGSYMPTAYYNETIDFITLNPRYRYSFFKNSFSVEAGLSLSMVRDNFAQYLSPDHYITLHPAIGTNISVGLNVAALCNKK